MSAESAPILSTPAEHILELPGPTSVQPSHERLSEEQLYLQYEIKRTISDIRAGKWKRIALQFPDDMLVDGPRVFERLRDGLKQAMLDANTASLSLNEGDKKTEDEPEERLCILADTSYGACCVDEVAAEHVDADVVVHYGRSCLSPTARLPVIYVFTEKALDTSEAVTSFKATYTDKQEKVVLMADIPYSHHLKALHSQLQHEGYPNLFTTDIIHDPSSPIPNRTIPPEAKDNADALKEYSIFHLSTPPTSLLLIVSSRIKALHIFSQDSAPSGPAPTATTQQLLRRRYALTIRLATVPIFGILINTLSVTNYMSALQHCQELISAVGKKSYVFVVGKVNAAKIANFSEIGAWVVIGCWESSLIESKEFYRPIITPFELEVTLMGDEKRTWGNEWIGDFSQLLGKMKKGSSAGPYENIEPNSTGDSQGNWDDMPSDDEPPEFDFRTGAYVSRSRPMGRSNTTTTTDTLTAKDSSSSSKPVAPPSSALVQRAKGDVVTVGGAVSPAAEYLRSQRTWTGLGSDHAIEYERGEDGKIRGAEMEVGRGGVAKGYSVGEKEEKR